MNEFLSSSIFTIGDWSLTPQRLFYFLLVTIVGLILNKMINARWKQRLYQPNEIDQASRKRFERYLMWGMLLLLLFAYIKVLGVDYIFFPTDPAAFEDGKEPAIILRITHLVVAFIILVGARITDWLLNNIISQYSRRSKGGVEGLLPDVQDGESLGTRIVQYIVVILTAILILKNFSLDFQLFSYTNGDTVISFRITKVLFALLILLLGRLVVWLVTQVILIGVYKRREIDTGGQFAINQLFKYVIYVIAFLMAIYSLGINMTLIWGGAAALLVGVGLGLQQTFNDFFSGLVLLFERSVSVGDILEFNGKVGTVIKIGLRSSIIETRGCESVIVPNSKLVNDLVVNWSHFTEKVRFQIDIGVAYGSNTQLVKKLLLQSASAHPMIMDYPTPFVRFQDFSDNALSFSVFFFTKNYIIVEDIKSDLRFELDKVFRENEIAIPFPQRDVWIRTVTDASKENE